MQPISNPFVVLLMSLIVVIIVTLCALFLRVITAKILYTDATIPEGLEARILMQRFHNSAECFARFDPETQRTYSQVIDVDKFTQYQLERCYNTDSAGKPAFRITLQKTFGVTYIPPIISKNWIGSDGEKTRNIPVIIYESGQLSGGNLLVEIQRY